GTAPRPLAVQGWGEITRKGNTLYLHCFEWPQDAKLVLGGLKSNLRSAFLLADSKRMPLSAARLNALDFLIQCPERAHDPTDSVVALEGDGQITTDSVRLLLAKTQNTLRVFDGQPSNRSLRFGPGKTRDAYVQNWSKADQFISW